MASIFMSNVRDDDHSISNRIVQIGFHFVVENFLWKIEDTQVFDYFPHYCGKEFVR